MPGKSKKSPPKRKPEVKAKSSPKKPVLRSVKLQAKPPAKPKWEAKAPPPKYEGSSILWKILAERERRKEKFQSKPQHTNHRGSQYPQASGKHEQFAKFAGPRRRAA